MRRSFDCGEISVGDSNVTVRLPDQSVIHAPVILGRITTDPDYEHLVLDRLVHRRDDTEVDGWSVFGAVVSELRRPLPSRSSEGA